MKRQWILTGVSVLLCCCLFVFVPGTTYATVVPGSSAYANSSFILDGASSASQSELMGYLLCTGFWVDDEFQEMNSWTEPTSSASHTWRVGTYTYGHHATCMYKLILRNNTNKDIRLSSTYINLIITPTNGTSGTTFRVQNLEIVSGQLTVDRVGTGGAYYFANAPEYALESNIVVPANGDLHCIFKVTYGATDSMASGSTINGFNITWNAPSIPLSYTKLTPGSVISSYPAYLRWIYQAVNDIKTILQNNQGAQDVEDESQQAQTDVDTAHQQETVYYQAAEDDIDAALTGFSVGQSESTAIGVVSEQFGDVYGTFDGLNEYGFVPVTALSLKLATTILRHAPRKRKEDD